MKILLAEDDFVTRKFMASFLSKYGECDVTVDGMEAVDAFIDSSPFFYTIIAKNINIANHISNVYIK